MPPKAKRSPDDLLVQLDTSALQKLAFGQEINVTTYIRSELTNCVVPPPEAGIAEGMQQLSTVPIPQSAFANVKGMSGQVALLFPPNCKFNEVESQQLIPGINPNISDDVSQQTYEELVKKLEINIFKHLFMQLFKSQKLSVQANQLSQRQYQTLVHLNLIPLLDGKFKDTIANLFRDPKAGFKNILNFDAKLNLFTNPVTLQEKTLTVQTLNYKVNGADYYYLNQIEQQRANDGEKYDISYAYCSMLNQLADQLDMDLIDILNGEIKLYTRSFEPVIEQPINMLERSVLCLVQIKNFRQFIAQALKKMFKDLIFDKNLVKHGVADIFATKTSTNSETPAPPSQEGNRPTSKEKPKSPVKGAKNAPEVPQVEPPNNKELFSDLKTPSGDGQSDKEKLDIIYQNIDKLVQGLPEYVQLPVLDHVTYDSRQFLYIDTFDKVLSTILNTNYQVNDQENGIRVYALFRYLAKEFNVMMPGITIRTYKDYQKPEKIKKKYDFMESQTETQLSDSDTDNPGEEKKKKVVQPLIPLPQLRGFKYNPMATQGQGKEGDLENQTGTLAMTMGMETISGTMTMSGLQTRVFTPKRKKRDYEPVWADSGREDDLFQDDYEDLPTTCYVEFSEIQDYIDYYITYTITDENKQVYFKQSGNIQQQASGKQQTAIQQSVQNYMYAENLSFNNKPVLDKVQPSALLKRYQSQITSNNKFYLLKLDKNNFDVNKTVLNLYTEYAGDYDHQITHLVIYYLSITGQWRQHERSFSQSTYSQLSNIGDNVDYSQEMIVMVEYLTKDGKLYTPGARTKITGFNYITHVGQELLFEPITNQQNNFYKNIAGKTLLVPENTNMISMIFQITLSEQQYQQGSIIAALEIQEPVDGLKMTAQVISDYDTMNVEFPMFEDQKTYPFEIQLKHNVNSFYLVIKEYVERSTVQLNVKLHLVGSVDVIQEVKQLNYCEQYSAIITVEENNRTGYNILQTKPEPVFAQIFYVDEEAELIPAPVINAGKQPSKPESRTGSKLGKEVASEVSEQPKEPENAEQTEIQKEKQFQEVSLVYFDLPSEKELKKAQDAKAAAAAAPKGGAKGGPEVETVQVDTYMDKAIKRMTKKSQNIGITRQDVIQEGQFFFFDVFRPELMEMNIQFTGKGKVKLVLYTLSDTGIQMTPFSMTQTIMSRISSKLYTKEYLTTSEATRKQLNVQTNIQTANCDVAKLPPAVASTLQLMQAQTDAKGAKKGAVDAQKPDAAFQQLLSTNKQATFDAILDETVLGAPVDDKKKAPPPKKDKAPQRGFLAGILEDLTKDVEVDRTEIGKQLDVIIYDPSNVNTANATEVDGIDGKAVNSSAVPK